MVLRLGSFDPKVCQSVRVVVGDTQGDLSGSQLVQQHMAVGLPGTDKGDLLSDLGGPAHAVGSQGLFKIGVAVGGVVEPGNGLVEGGGRVALKR